MTAYENSASRQAAQIRAHARRGLWRRVTAAVGMNPQAARADAQARAWTVGGEGEAATKALLNASLPARGWHVRHDLRPPGRRKNFDHVLTSPCGTTVVLLDSKKWRRNWTTHLHPVTGRVHCDLEDRHGEIQKAVDHALEVQGYLALPGVTVWPLLVVHGSPVAGGVLGARATGWQGPVYVLSPPYLVPTLAAGPKVFDPQRAAVVAARVDSVLRPYGEGR